MMQKTESDYLRLDLAMKRTIANQSKNHHKNLHSRMKTKELIKSLAKKLQSGNKIQESFYSIIPRALFKFKIRNQLLLLQFALSVIVIVFYSIIQYRHSHALKEGIQDGSNQILSKANFNSQARALNIYMGLIFNYFYNRQQVLLAITQIYQHSSYSDDSIDLGLQCQDSNSDEIYQTLYIQMFCFTPYGISDNQTYENTTLNEDFIKFIKILNQFILTFDSVVDQQQYTALSIALLNQDQMSAFYPQTLKYHDYSPIIRPWFTSQQEYYENHQIQDFYLSDYYQLYKPEPVQSIQYAQSLGLSLIQNMSFKGVISNTIQFKALQEQLSGYNEFSFTLTADDGTILFQKNNLGLNIFSNQIFIYNQSITGFNYQDWNYLQNIAQNTTNASMNNTLFELPIQINIKKFNDLPYYFMISNTLIYQNTFEDIQQAIFTKLDLYIEDIQLTMLIVIGLILGISYLCIIHILKPISKITHLIKGDQKIIKQIDSIESIKDSNNILNILYFLILLKNSEFQNIGLFKNQICEDLENFKFPVNTYNDLSMIQYEFDSIQDNVENYLISEFRSAKFVGFRFTSIDQIIDQKSSGASLQLIKY